MWIWRPYDTMLQEDIDMLDAKMPFLQLCVCYFQWIMFNSFTLYSLQIKCLFKTRNIFASVVYICNMHSWFFSYSFKCNEKVIIMTIDAWTTLQN